MKIKILTREQLEGIVYTWINQNPDCVIDLFDEYLHKSLYISSKKLSEETILLNITVENTSIGNPIHIKDNKSKMEWIKEKCGYIDWECARLTARLEDKKVEETADLNYIDTYNKEYTNTKKSVPMIITNMDDAMYLFTRFLINDYCTHLVFTFGVYVPCINSPFNIEITIDKYYMNGRTIICFTNNRINKCNYENTNKFNSFLVMYPGNKIEVCTPRDALIEYIPENINSVKELSGFLYNNIKSNYNRCAIISKEEINIYVYSNCELI